MEAVYEGREKYVAQSLILLYGTNRDVRDGAYFWVWGENRWWNHFKDNNNNKKNHTFEIGLKILMQQTGPDYLLDYKAEFRSVISQ